MTDPGYADSTYIEPLTSEFIKEIIRQERPDSILPTMGGQTSLNLILELSKGTFLQEFGIDVIGVSLKTIKLAEDRNIFNKLMRREGFIMPNSWFIRNIYEAKDIINELVFPIIIRTCYSLGGKGGGFAKDPESFLSLCKRGFKISPEGIMVEKSLHGWKEFELEVMRDRVGNCIVVCSIENMGIQHSHFYFQLLHLQIS